MFLDFVRAFFDFPQLQMFGCGREHVFLSSLLIGYPHDLGWRKFVLKLVNFGKTVVRLLKIEIYDVDEINC